MRIQKINGEVTFGVTGSGTFSCEHLDKIIITQDMNVADERFHIMVRKKWI